MRINRDFEMLLGGVKRTVLAFLFIAVASGSLAAQTRAELEKKYGRAEPNGHYRWMFQVRPEVSLSVIFKRNGKPALMKLASRFDRHVMSERLTDEIIHELWSNEELVEDKNGLRLSISSSQCNGQEYVTYQHFTIKMFRACSTKSERLETGIESLEVTWNKMSFENPKSVVLVHDSRLR